MSSIHDVRESFDIDLFLKARELTIKAVEEIKKQVFIGMSESDGIEIIDKVLDKLGAEKKWHPNKFRIGCNTTKSFRDISEEGIVLKEEDILFIDIGPVFNNHEGDYGQTFSIGNIQGHKDIIKACKEVFDKTKLAWQKDNLSGKALYDFAEKYAKSIGYNLNTRMKGHRIGDFPHHLFYKGGLIETDETPCENLWVLEIHLISEDGKFGSFFEDILRK